MRGKGNDAQCRKGKNKGSGENGGLKSGSDSSLLLMLGGAFIKDDHTLAH